MGATTTCFVKKGDFVTRVIADETILVPVRGRVGDLNAIYNFNEVGTYIWERLDSGSDVGEIAEAVAGEFEVTPGEAQSDTREFVASLESAGLIAPAREVA